MMGIFSLIHISRKKTQNPPFFQKFYRKNQKNVKIQFYFITSRNKRQAKNRRNIQLRRHFLIYFFFLSNAGLIA